MARAGMIERALGLGVEDAEKLSNKVLRTRLRSAERAAGRAGGAIGGKRTAERVARGAGVGASSGARPSYASSARFQAAQARIAQSARGTSGGAPIAGSAPWHPGRNTSKRVLGPKGPRQPSWLKQHPAKAAGFGALGLAGLGLARNQGPGVTGNGYMPTGSSSGGGGRRF